MSKTIKIQCPTCGAPNGYEEIVPSKYKCGYCFTNWQQASEINVDTQRETSLYEEAIIIYTEHVKLTPDRPKYFFRMKEAIFRMDELIKKLTDTKLQQQLVPKLSELILREIAMYDNINLNTSSNRHDLFDKDSDKYYQWLNLSHFYTMIAYHICMHSEEKSKLQRAVGYLKKAEIIYGTDIDDYEPTIAQCRVGVLQRLENEENTFEYIYYLLNRFSLKKFKKAYKKEYGDKPDNDDVKDFKEELHNYTEQVRFDFEDLIYNDTFKVWQETKDEAIKNEKQENKNKQIELETTAKKDKKKGLWSKLFG